MKNTTTLRFFLSLWVLLFATASYGQTQFPLTPNGVLDNVKLVALNNAIFDLPNSICQSNTLPNLASFLSSVPANGITGTWNPATVSNTTTTTYTFTPTAGQCARQAAITIPVERLTNYVANPDVYYLTLPTANYTSTSILANDTYNGNQITSMTMQPIWWFCTPVLTTAVPTITPGGIIINPNQTITVLAGTPAGTYTFMYALNTTCGQTTPTTVTIMISNTVQPAAVRTGLYTFCFDYNNTISSTQTTLWHTLYDNVYFGTTHATAANSTSW